MTQLQSRHHTGSRRKSAKRGTHSTTENRVLVKLRCLSMHPNVVTIHAREEVSRGSWPRAPVNWKPRRVRHRRKHTCRRRAQHLRKMQGLSRLSIIEKTWTHQSKCAVSPEALYVAKLVRAPLFLPRSTEELSGLDLVVPGLPRKRPLLRPVRESARCSEARSRSRRRSAPRPSSTLAS